MPRGGGMVPVKEFSVPEVIRLGIIRCDTHGMWYAPLMAEHDPLVFQRPTDPRQLQSGSYTWQAGGCYRYFYTYYGNPLKMSVPFVGGFEVVNVWDERRDAAEQAQAVFFGKPRICDTPDQVSEGVDLVLLADANLHGEDHLELARPGLERGVATFVDKPFAGTVAQAREILELARKHDAPVFSLSILRAEPAIARFRARFAEVGEVSYATVAPVSEVPAYLVHGISCVQNLFGAGIDTVHVLTAPEQSLFQLSYGDKPDRPRHGVTMHAHTSKQLFSPLHLSAYGSMASIDTTILGQFAYPHGTIEIIKIIKEMMRTRQTPALMDEVIESIAVIEAIKKAKQTGKAARVAEFL